MDLNAFPDPVLRAVFDRVPLSDLGRHIPLVCHRWHSLQPSVISGKKNLALTLMVGEDAPQMIKDSSVLILFGDELTNEDGSKIFPSPMDDPRLALSLTLRTLTSRRVDSLTEKLSNVAHLKICYCKFPPIADPTSIPLIVRLLEHWASGLKTLKMHCSFADEEEENARVLTIVAVQLARLIETVNKLPLLEHLTLDLHEDLRMVTPLELPVLSRLKEFYFFSDDNKEDLLFKSLKSYAEPNEKLHRIGLGSWGEMHEYLKEFGDSTLAKRFTMLSRVIGNPLYGANFNDSDRVRFLNTFSSQIKYSIKMKDLNLVQLTTILTPLKSLVHLHLGCEQPFTNFDTDPVAQIRPLPSVKVLSLVITTRTHKELASKHWARMFPNLQIVMLFHTAFGCTICGFDDAAREVKPETVAPCIHRTLLPFKQAFRRTLKKVYYCRNDHEENIKVFTPDDI